MSGGRRFVSFAWLALLAVIAQPAGAGETEYCLDFSAAALGKREAMEKKALGEVSAIHRAETELRPTQALREKRLAEFQSLRRQTCQRIKKMQLGMVVANELANTKLEGSQCAAARGQGAQLSRTAKELQEEAEKLDKIAAKVKNSDEEGATLNERVVRSFLADHPEKKTELARELNQVWESRHPGTIFKPLVQGLFEEQARLATAAEEVRSVWARAVTAETKTCK